VFGVKAMEEYHGRRHSDAGQLEDATGLFNESTSLSSLIRFFLYRHTIFKRWKLRYIKVLAVSGHGSTRGCHTAVYKSVM
jgi:hypothetical protein